MMMEHGLFFMPQAKLVREYLKLVRREKDM
jgi:hypothetical protein